MASVRHRAGLGLGLVASLMVATVATAQKPPDVGDQAPEFRLQDQAGQWHALSDYRGKWVVLYFYPKDNTPGCTTEACSIRDNMFAFRDLGVTVLGVSVDDVASHKSFADEHQLPFTLLADPDKKVTDMYGVLTRYLGMMELARRDTFIIDPQGNIVKHYVKVDPKEHSGMVLKDLRLLIGAPGQDKAG